MKRYWLVFAGVILGCAGTVAIPLIERALAQSYGANPAAPRWEQQCQILGARGRSRAGHRQQSDLERAGAVLQAPRGRIGPPRVRAAPLELVPRVERHRADGDHGPRPAPLARVLARQGERPRRGVIRPCRRSRAATRGERRTWRVRLAFAERYGLVDAAYDAIPEDMPNVTVSVLTRTDRR